jgi:sugar phosphate isomerase/epimerase
LLSKLADKYKINVAIHDHPAPSLYWDPDFVLAAIKGQSQRIGACADIGHWVRSGLDPLACIKKLEGHIIELHVKDLNEKSADAHDVIWGTGISDIAGILKELRGQQFKGAFFAEYEYHWENSTPEVAAGIRYFREVAAGLR